MLTRFVDRFLSALFQLADYVTSRLSSSSPESAGNNTPAPIIRFSPEDI